MENHTDLLGLDFGEQPAVELNKADDLFLQPESTHTESAQHRLEDDSAIAYPPAWSTAIRSVEDEDPSSPSGLREFTVRCQGRWRVRNAPSLNSRVVGSVSSGTIVFGHNAVMPGTNQTPSSASDSLNCLWVRVSRFESKEAGGVSEIRHDKASGGAMYCLRRNALGYGLYENGVESLEGPLIFLPEELATDLRDDAQRTNIERNEDVSLTWKLLSAADSFSRFFSPESGVDEMKLPTKKRAEEIFEVKQRELLKKSAASLSSITTKITSARSSASGREDLTAQLPKEVRGRYARLRSALAEASANLPGTNEMEPSSASGQAEIEGCSAELQTFAAHCLRLERAGGWPELTHEVRQEIIHFTQRHLPDLESHARTLSRGSKKPDSGSSPTISPIAKSEPQSPIKMVPSPTAKATVDIDSIDLLGGGKSSNGYRKTSNGSSGMCAFLPPPPPPANSVGQLI